MKGRREFSFVFDFHHDDFCHFSLSFPATLFQTSTINGGMAEAEEEFVKLNWNHT